MLLHETLVKTAQRVPEDEALVAGGRRYRYGQILVMVERISALLQEKGVRPGDRVAIMLPNGVEAVVACYAAMKAGAIFMPLSPLIKRDRLEYILRDAEPAGLVTDEHGLRTYRSLMSGIPSVQVTILCGNRGEDVDAEHVVPFERAVLDPRAEAAGPVLSPHRIDQDLAAIIYTSGSTGHPKGVMLTHLNILSASSSIIEYLGLAATDNILCVLPLSFDYGLYQVLMAFRLGARVTLARSLAFPADVLETMALERVTVLPGVPTAFSILLRTECPEKLDLGALRIITNTGAALSRTQIDGIRRAFPGARLFSMYGLTECKRVSYLPPEELDRRPDSVGRGMPNQEVYLVDDAGRRLAPGSVGELVIRGSHVMRGYWRKPRETAACLRPGPYPGESVLHSGDLFRTDEEGYLYFVGRRDDMIKSGGEKVSPKEVENVLYALEGVAEAAVIGVADGLLGQAVKAFVVLDAGVHLTERDVLRHCAARLEPHGLPRYIEFVRSLPHTDTGKVAKAELRDAGVMVAQDEGSPAGFQGITGIGIGKGAG
ncbi:MAG: class I adenylate-forming enzyme family protein [Acidiferrobacteraceae bacterium]